MLVRFNITLTKIIFRFLRALMLLCIIFICGTAGYTWFLMGDYIGAIKMLFFLIALMFYFALIQQILLWLLPKKDRKFWQDIKFI